MKTVLIIGFLSVIIFIQSVGMQNEELQPIPFIQTDTTAEIQKFSERLAREYAEKANQITNYYLIAQRSLYKQEYEIALENINMALDIHKNSDLLALKASVYFAMNSFEEAGTLFTEAFLLDKDLPLPHLSGLKEWIKKEGLREK